MFTHQKLRIFFFFFLAFCVLSSKHIIIYNEETLVALSFFCFVFFISRYFGNTITESLNERSEIIQQELHNFLNRKQKSLKELFVEHQKISSVVNGLHNLTLFTTQQIRELHTKTQFALYNVFIEQIQLKFKTLALSKVMLQQKLQYFISENILLNVLLLYHSLKPETTKSKNFTLSQKSIQKSIQLLLKSQTI